MSFKQKLGQLGKQPDIVLIITDEQTTPTENYPSDWEERNMPSLTFLKKNGFTFNKAFCNTCMCSPSRATLFSGTYPAIHGVSQTLTIGGLLSPAEPTLSNTMPNIMNTLWAAGYDVQYRGKWHMSKGAAGTGTTTNYDELTASDIALFGAMGWQAPDAGEDVNPLNFGGGYANHDAKYVAQAIAYLKQVRLRRASGDHKPYCLILSLVNPHDVLAYPNTAGTYGYHPSTWESRDIRLPATVNENLLKSKKPLAQELILLGMAGLLGPLTNDEQKLNYVNFYAYLQTLVDKEIGKFIEELYRETEEGRLADKAIVIQTSDHGEMGLAHGGLRQKTFVAYEEAIKVPMVFSNPVLFDSEVPRSSAALATLVDIMPTLMDIANVQDPPTGLAGTSLLPVIADGKPVQSSILFTFDDTKAGSNSKWSAVNAANRIRCIRTEEWKYDYYFDAMGSYANQYELYNLKADPLEAVNLAYDPAYKKIREELEQQLKELEHDKLLIRAQNDTARPKGKKVIPLEL
ncbi:sulfatase-like hydrolase/transferase [Chitinophagaceae bacterium MMS25-I14]